MAIRLSQLAASTPIQAAHSHQSDSTTSRLLQVSLARYQRDYTLALRLLPRGNDQSAEAVLDTMEEPLSSVWSEGESFFRQQLTMSAGGRHFYPRDGAAAGVSSHPADRSSCTRYEDDGSPSLRLDTSDAPSTIFSTSGYGQHSSYPTAKGSRVAASDSSSILRTPQRTPRQKGAEESASSAELTPQQELVVLMRQRQELSDELVRPLEEDERRKRKLYRDMWAKQQLRLTEQFQRELEAIPSARLTPSPSRARAKKKEGEQQQPPLLTERAGARGGGVGMSALSTADVQARREREHRLEKKALEWKKRRSERGRES